MNKERLKSVLDVIWRLALLIGAGLGCVSLFGKPAAYFLYGATW